MLTAELAWHQQLAPGVPPDGVLVHRKQRSPEDNTLVYDVRCKPGTSQVRGQAVCFVRVECGRGCLGTMQARHLAGAVGGRLWPVEVLWLAQGVCFGGGASQAPRSLAGTPGPGGQCMSVAPRHGVDSLVVRAVHLRRLRRRWRPSCRPGTATASSPACCWAEAAGAVWTWGPTCRWWCPRRSAPRGRCARPLVRLTFCRRQGGTQTGTQGRNAREAGPKVVARQCSAIGHFGAAVVLMCATLSASLWSLRLSLPGGAGLGAEPGLPPGLVQPGRRRAGRGRRRQPRRRGVLVGPGPRLLPPRRHLRLAPRGPRRVSSLATSFHGTAATRALLTATGGMLPSPDWSRCHLVALGVCRYAMLGDVVVLGTEAPSRPVRMYRDGLLSAGAGGGAGSDAAAGGGGGGGGGGDAPSEGPRLAPCQGYALVFRDGANPALTLWRPIPRRGYVDVSLCQRVFPAWCGHSSKSRRDHDADGQPGACGACLAVAVRCRWAAWRGPRLRSRRWGWCGACARTW